MDDYQYLEELGFSKNEAKVYISLLKYGTMNGYEIAKQSGVTRTMIYDVLSRLVQKRYVNEVEAKPKMYSAVGCRELIGDLKKESENRINDLEKVLDRVSGSAADEQFVMNIKGFQAFLGEVRRMIEKAKTEIYISIWDDEASFISDVLADADKRGVKIYIFSFSKLPFSFGTQYTYNINGSGIFNDAHRMTVIADRKTMAVGEYDDRADRIAIVTENRMLVKMAADQIVLDIMNLYSAKKSGLVRDSMDAADYVRASVKYNEYIGLPRDVYERMACRLSDGEKEK